MADTDYKDQIRELRCWTEKTWAPKYRINLLPRNQTGREQYAAVAEDIFSSRLVLLFKYSYTKIHQKTERFLKYETSILSKSEILNWI